MRDEAVAYRLWVRLLRSVALLARRVAMRTQAGPMRPWWRLTYELLARSVGLALTAGLPGASVYVAASVASGDPVYGLSDIDLAIVVRDSGIVHRRWDSLRHLLPPVGDLFSDLAIYEPAELRAAASESTFTHVGNALYLGGQRARDGRGLRERPGLEGPTLGWRRLRGIEQRPIVKAGDAQRLRIAAWQELQFWWRQAMECAVNPAEPHSHSARLKLVTHAARAWLAVEHGEHPSGRDDVLRRARQTLPEEDEAVRSMISLAASPQGGDELGWDQALGLLVRLSSRIAGRFEVVAGEAGRVLVRLSGATQVSPLPLIDWRGLVLPALPDDSLIPTIGDPGHRATLAASVQASARDRYCGLKARHLLVLAAGNPWTRSFLRAVACPATDPVSFALIDGFEVAHFPRLAGWSIHDVARRAVAEHRAWLEQAPDDGALAERPVLDGRNAGAPAPVRVAAKLLTAARAAVLSESLHDGTPELAVGIPTLGMALAERHPSTRSSVEEVAGAYLGGELPDWRALGALRANLRSIPAFAAAVSSDAVAA